jgi:hypothetical protein
VEAVEVLFKDQLLVLRPEEAGLGEVETRTEPLEPQIMVAVVAVVATAVATLVAMVALVLSLSKSQTHALQHFLAVLHQVFPLRLRGTRFTQSLRLQRHQKRSHLAEEPYAALCKN